MLKENAMMTPMEPGKVLMKCDESMAFKPHIQFKFRSGVGKLLHMMLFSIPETMNSVHELSRFMMDGAGDAHAKALHQVMAYFQIFRNKDRSWSRIGSLMGVRNLN
jgi:hypothetical protein